MSASRESSSRKGSSASSRTSSSRKSALRKSSSSGRSASGSSRTREQLYKQATRLKVEGRSRMTKAELERAVERAKSRRS